MFCAGSQKNAWFFSAICLKLISEFGESQYNWDIFLFPKTAGDNI